MNRRAGSRSTGGASRRRSPPAILRLLPLAALVLSLVPACSNLGAGAGYGTSAYWIEMSFPEVIVGDRETELTWTLRHVGDTAPQGPFECIVDPGDGREAFELIDCSESGSLRLRYQPQRDAITLLTPSIEMFDVGDERSMRTSPTTGYLVPDDAQNAFFRLTPSVRSGPAPLTVEFDTLAVYAGELGTSHPLTCALVYDDLTTEDTGRIWRPCNQGADNAFQPDDLVHTYTQPGVYQVWLTAWLPGGDSGFYPRVEATIEVR